MSPDIGQLIGTVGFPAGVAGFLVWWLTKSLNGKLDRLTAAVEKSTAAVDRLADKIPHV